MTLEPRSVEPGFVSRWPKQAAELLLRAFHPWMAFSVASCLLIAVLPLNGLLCIPLGMFLYFASCDIASRSDAEHVGIEELLHALADAGRVAVRDTWRRRWLIAFSLALGFALVTLIPHRPATVAAPAADGLLHWLVGLDSPLTMAAASLWAGAFFQGNGLQLPMTHYCVRRLLNVSPEQAELLVRKAAMRNPMCAAFLDTVHLGTLMVALMALPVLTPILACVLPALTHVACREMFVDGNGNRVPTARAAASVQPSLTA